MRIGSVRISRASSSTGRLKVAEKRRAEIGLGEGIRSERERNVEKEEEEEGEEVEE